ncbi:MAG TPA: hypothetical protein VGP99_13850 [Tepidisphaeraceae bacterium]|jgi:hypothetical protein|nr:hypothetical protein [Tepidisphaeraceae bacterium]
MNRLRTVGLCLLAALFLTGCTREKPQETKAPPAPIGDEVIAAYRKKHPDALIGRVVAVRPEDRLLAAGDLPVADFKPGDAVVILGSNQEQIATGDVVSTGKNWIHVHYGESTAGQRAPNLGDLVVRFKH